MRTITLTPSGHEVGASTSPHTWRKAVQRGYDFLYERGGMRDMPHDLYAVAMHLGNADVSHRDAPGMLRQIDHAWHITYSPTPVTSIVSTTATQVRLIIRLLVALGYLRVISEPRAGRGGEGIYELTEPADTRGPDIPAAFGILDKASRTPSRRGHDMTIPNAARSARRPVDNVRLDLDAAASNGRPDDYLNGRPDDYLNGRPDDRFDEAPPYMGFRGIGTTGINGVPEVTTDAVDNGSRSGQEEESEEGAAGTGSPTLHLVKATLRSAIQEVSALRTDLAAARREQEERRIRRPHA